MKTIIDKVKELEIKKLINYLDDNASKVVGNVEVSLNGKVYFKTGILVQEEKNKEEKPHNKLSFFKRLILWIKSLW